MTNNKSATRNSGCNSRMMRRGATVNNIHIPLATIDSLYEQYEPMMRMPVLRPFALVAVGDSIIAYAIYLLTHEAS